MPYTFSEKKNIWSHWIMMVSAASKMRAYSNFIPGYHIRSDGQSDSPQLEGTVDGRNPAKQLRLVVFPRYLQGFRHPMWWRISSIHNSMQIHETTRFFLPKKMTNPSWSYVDVCEYGRGTYIII